MALGHVHFIRSSNDAFLTAHYNSLTMQSAQQLT